MRLLFLVEHFRWQGTGLEHSAVRLCRGLAAMAAHGKPCSAKCSNA